MKTETQETLAEPAKSINEKAGGFERKRRWRAIIGRYEGEVDMLLANSRKRYKPKIGAVVSNLVPVIDDDGEIVEPGTRLVVLDVTPSVRPVLSKDQISDAYLAAQGMDRYDHFLNLERLHGSKARIRENRIVVQKV